MIKIMFEGEDFDAIQRQMIDMLNGLGRPPVPVERHTRGQEITTLRPDVSRETNATQDATQQVHEHTHGNGPTGQVERSGRLSADDLIKAMKLKPTQTSTLGGGTIVKNGDHVACNGEEWVICQTYRGKLVAQTEDGKADVLDAGACTPPSQRTQQSAPSVENRGAEGHPAEQYQPRPGTAAALLGPNGGQSQPQPGVQPLVAPQAVNGEQFATISSAEATALRDRLTTIVASGQLSPEKVFEVLSQFGAQTIDALTVATKPQFEQAINAVLPTQQQATPPGQFGF